MFDCMKKGAKEETPGQTPGGGDVKGPSVVTVVDVRTETRRDDNKLDLLYSIDQTPPWNAAILLGLQHFLTMFMSQVSAATIVADVLCVGNDTASRGMLIGTTLAVCGLSTLLQTTFGNRLPIVQGASAAFLVPVNALMSLPKWKCPAPTDTSALAANLTSITTMATTMATAAPEMMTWQDRILELQGALIGASAIHIVLGFSGLFGVLLRFISPLVVSVVIVMLAVPLVQIGGTLSGLSWPVAAMTTGLAVIFGQYFACVKIPAPEYSRKQRRCSVTMFPIFQVYPVLLAILLSWLVCHIITITGALDGPEVWKYMSRTDTQKGALDAAKWFRFPYPFQWGWPTFSAAAIVGMICGVFASTLESIGDYYTCAKLSGAPEPPIHAMNRGIGFEGIGNMICAFYGTGLGTTSYSDNIGMLAQTKVGSRRVIQIAAVWMLIFSVLGKFGALFATIPVPIIGGIVLFITGFVVSAGLSFLKYVNMDKTRNLIALGLPIVFGLGIPMWLESHPEAITTGNAEANQVLLVLLKSNMLVGGILAAILDTTIPGKGKGGIKGTEPDDDSVSAHETYDCPFGMGPLRRIQCFSKWPFCPTFTGCCKKGSESYSLGEK